MNLFIADDVGLGKTIEAGLIIRELLMRQKVKRIVVSSPASVVLQWRDELESRFGLTFVVLDREYVLRCRRAADPVVSGAVGGPSTGAGLNYQIDYALLRVLRLFPEVLSFPIRNPFIRIEPEVQRRKKGGGQLGLTLVNVANCFGSTSNKIRKLTACPTQSAAERRLRTLPCRCPRGSRHCCRLGLCHSTHPDCR